ncbi:hypothetical protein [Actinomycetospora chiangmaiensis]|uniref:hypothetical protein n=1 Tax=Actinomycetospora chiangmaiensis TaxID=402650 RepID=UPI0012FBD04B|nr:hypothetical protein [Actinomycetospora chiangmaiensis]
MAALFLVWFIVGGVHRAMGRPDPSGSTTLRSATEPPSLHHSLRSGIALVLVTAIIVVGGVVAATTVDALVLEGLSDPSGVLTALILVLPVVSLLAIPAILVGDALVAHRVVRRQFRRAEFSTEPDDGADMTSSLRRWGRTGAADQIASVRAAERGDPGDHEAEVAVFRGTSPFIGSGVLYDRRVAVFPLKRVDPDDDRPVSVSEYELHHGIYRRIRNLVRASTLSPRNRLEELRHYEQILVSAEELVAAWPDEDARTYLPRTDQRPVSRMSSKDAQEHIGTPREWARYYQLFQVEGWERDLTVSCHTTLGADGGLLYLEWALCVLPPVASAYHVVDHRRDLRRLVLDRALDELIEFPASLPARLRRLVGQFRPLRVDPGELVAEKYGAGPSMRELAAAPAETYFHGVDIRRYVSVLDRSILEAVRTYLEDHRLSVADFDQITGTIINIGTIANSTVAAGPGAQATQNESPAPTGRTPVHHSPAPGGKR